MVSFFQSIGNASDGISSKDPTLTCEMGKCRAKSCASGCHLRASSQCPCRRFHSCLFPFIFPFRRPEALDRHRSPHRNTFLGQRQFFCSFPSRRRSRSPPCQSRSRPLTCSCSFPCRTWPERSIIDSESTMLGILGLDGGGCEPGSSSSESINTGASFSTVVAASPSYV